MKKEQLAFKNQKCSL